MTTLADLPVSELAIRDWLRTQSAITDILSGDTRRIDIDPHPTASCISLYRAGGAPDAYVPYDIALMSFHCWGTERSRRAALDLQTALCGVLNSMKKTPLNDSAVGLGANVESAYWSPDPSGRPRYVVMATVTTRISTQAA